MNLCLQQALVDHSTDKFVPHLPPQASKGWIKKQILFNLIFILFAPFFVPFFPLQEYSDINQGKLAFIRCSYSTPVK